MSRIFALWLSFTCVALAAPRHPGLLWSADEISEVRSGLGQHPLFDAALQEARDLVANALSHPIEVPQPKDAAGYTHERHKLNYREMHAAGLLYQLTGDPRLVDFIRAQLKAYAALYPTLGKHPAGTSTSPGRIFWQSLNESVWLVNVSQAYDFIYEALRPEERALFEANIFRPMCKFFVEERVHEFDRMHNHGTWTVTAVAMAGYAIEDETLVDKALYGSKTDGKTGFLRQVDALYSPDGLYCEGPYYGRYAIMPFYLMGRVLEERRPKLGIFTLRDGLLRKALYSQLQLTDASGAFLPYNDSLKEKSHRSPEILMALAEVYAHQGRDPGLLAVARRQGAVALTPAGFTLAKALEEKAPASSFPYSSVEYKDGPEGLSGGLGVLRAGPSSDQALLCLKYGVHGMEHGHFDKLSFQFYEQGREILPDYGSARFLNVDQKKGGRYLSENKTWAMQTLAHNTVTVDGRSQFDGNYDASEASHAERHFFQAKNPNFQVMSAREDKAYPGVSMLRSLALINDARLSRPIIVDVYRLSSEKTHRYDYVLNYPGQFLSTNVQLQVQTQARAAMGTSQGYQHLWLEAEGNACKNPLRFTWMNGERFYSLTAATDASSQLLMTSLGANDPSFNLRREAGLIHRRTGASVCFATVIEPHGAWDGNKETCSGNLPTIQDVQVLYSGADATILRVKGTGSLSWTLLLNAGPASEEQVHRIKVNEEVFEWQGNAALQP